MGFTFNPQLYLSHCAELIAGMTSPLQEGQLMNKASVDYFWFVLKTELRDTHRERERQEVLLQLDTMLSQDQDRKWGPITSCGL